jgi:aryl carrier-like protein
VPCGVVGELYSGGAGVAIGYLNREALTKEKFIDNPIIPGEKLYRTGDLVQWNNSAQLEFVGRTDHQVKIRGYRVELTEIEKVILSFKGIDKCLVAANRYEHGVIKLCAYVIYHSNYKESDTNLREYLHSKLPEYMVPTALCRLENFPLNNNGKIDRKALPEPTDFVDHTNFKPPSKPEEQILIDIWQALLRVKKIGISDNFFSLGGDSIIAIQVISQLKERGYAAETAHIFQYQTIEELAEHIAVAKPQETQAFEDTIVSDYEAGKLDQSELDDIFADLNIL